MDEILVSVIIPVFNAEKYIVPCISSIQKQTYKSIEIIVVNDHSVDSTYYIVNSMLKEDPRVRIIQNKKKGANYARQLGVEHSTGNYIIFSDAD